MSGAGGRRLGIVVVNYGSSALLARNVASIDRTGLVATEVVVVDNPTSTTEREAVQALADEHGWQVVESETNVGFGAGMNAGVRRAIDSGCTDLLCLNPDVSITGADIRRLLDVVAAHPRTLVTPRIHLPDGAVWFAGGQLDLRSGLTRSRPDDEQRGPERFLTGACLVLDRASWDLAGGFDDRYFLYWEDLDLSQRMLERGGELLVCHDVVVSHEVGATQGQQLKSTLYARYNCRNRLLFATDHQGPAGRVRWLLHSPRYAVRILLRNGRRPALRRPAMVVAVCRGTLEGAGFVARSIVTDVGRRLRRR